MGLVDSLIVGRRLRRRRGIKASIQSDVPVSTVWSCGQFPGRREKRREYRRFRRLSAKSVSKISVTPVICEENPYAVRGGVGNFFVRAGNYFRLFDRGRENGIKSIRSPRRSTYCALSPQRRPCHARVRRRPIIAASAPPSLRAQRSNPGATARGPWIASSQGLLAMTVNSVIHVPQVTFLILGVA